MLDVLRNWNRWGENPLPSGVVREVTSHVVQLLDIPEVLTLVGMRRAGKSTVMFQLMDHLEAQGLPQHAMLHVNFEDPGFSNHMTPSLLDEIYRIYREEVYPEGKAYLFLDEIQVVPEWERWVRARNETENIKIIVSGSSAKLMSRELGTLLTGRHVSIDVYPLSFREYLAFKGISVPKVPLPNDVPTKINAALRDYLNWGGLPRIALEEEEVVKRALLRNYLSDILFKDIAMRHDIRNMNLLRNLTVHLFTQTASLSTYKRLANLFQVSQEVIQTYCNYIEEAFLVHLVPLYSLKSSEVNRNPRKCHVHDLGFRQIANLSFSEDYGRCAESIVHNLLNRRSNDGVFYWKKISEIDLIVREGNNVAALYQVAYGGLDNAKTLDRELSALAEAQKEFPKAEKYLIVDRLLTLKAALPSYVKMLPLWRFLIDV